MNEYILNMTTEEITKLVTNIKSEHLCLLMIILNSEAQMKIFATMSQKAQDYLKQDINKIKMLVPNI